MSHLIDMSNNRANIAYAGKTPWHGLGQQIDSDAPIDEWKIAAGLDWHIEKRPKFYPFVNEDGSTQPVKLDGWAHVRSDTQTVLGEGSDRFQLVQPGDTLEFYRDLVEGSRFKIETAGALNDGRKIWALARSNLELRIGDKDLLYPYLLLATANDGSMSTVADFTTVRVVCNNTLTMAVGHNANKMSVKVPHSRKFDANRVKSQLGLIDDRLETFAADADRLSQRELSDREAVNYFAELYARVDDDGELTNKATVERTVNRLMNLYKSGPGADLASSQNTAWGAVNALTHMLDFELRARSDSNRFASTQLGDGAKIKAKAFDAALALAA